MRYRNQHVEEHRVRGERLLARARELVHQGNIRRVIIKNADGVTLIEVPLSVGLAGAVLIPVWVAIGALAALAADYRIAVVKHPEPQPLDELLRPEEPPMVAVGELGGRGDI